MREWCAAAAWVARELGISSDTLRSSRCIASAAAVHAAALSCAALGVSRSGIYAWRQRERDGAPVRGGLATAQGAVD